MSNTLFGRCLLAMGMFSAACSSTFGQAASESSGTPPSVVLIYIDDMGYGDVHPLGSPAYATPNLERLAAEGCVLTDFHVSSAVCSASRAALLTGSYHERVGIRGALNSRADHGLSPGETTIAEVCKTRDYATGCFGKWHLGHHPKYLPTNQGFDYYYGLPYSNDMWPGTDAARENKPRDKWRHPPLPLIENQEVIDADVTEDDQRHLTKNYTEKAVGFIRDNKDRPFFVYLPHSMVHVPLYVSPEFEGKTGKGLYADVVAEVDWSVGQILDTLEELGLDGNTLVLFTSDNGPWLSFGKHGGTAGELREGKGTSFEGGIRVPAIARLPGRIPAGSVCDVLCGTVDVLPTVAKLIDAPLPDRKIDGHSLVDVLSDPDSADSPHDSMPIYYANGQLQAVRTEDWKLVLPHGYRSLAKDPAGYGRGPDDGSSVPYKQLKVQSVQLYDMQNDRNERTDVAADHPEVVKQLTQYAEQWREELGDSLVKRSGRGLRPAERLQDDDKRLTW